jgi:hypothetical protein
VTDFGNRLGRLEAEVAALKPSLAERLEKLEQANAAVTEDGLKPWWQRLLGWLGDEGPKFVTAVVLLVLGYWIKDSVDEAIKHQQLQLDFTKQMQSQLEILGDPASDKEKLERAATLVATYGAPAILPLLNELRYEGLRASAAERGLALLALSDPDALCRVLPRVLTNRTGQFTWSTHLRVIRLIGESGCTKAAAGLAEYLTQVRTARTGASTTPYFDLVVDRPTPDQFDQLESALNRSLLIINRK